MAKAELFLSPRYEFPGTPLAKPPSTAREIIPPAPQPQDLSPLVPFMAQALTTFRELDEARNELSGHRQPVIKKEDASIRDRLLAKEIFCQIQIAYQKLRPFTAFFSRLIQPQKKQSLEQKAALTQLALAVGSVMAQAFEEKNFPLTGKLGKIHEHLRRKLAQPTVKNQIPHHPRERTILRRVIERELVRAGIKTPQEISFKETSQSHLFLVARREYTQEAWTKGFPPPLRFYLASFLCRDRLNQGVRAQMVCLGEVPHGEKQIQPRTQPVAVREAFIPDHSRVIFPLFTR